MITTNYGFIIYHPLRLRHDPIWTLQAEREIPVLVCARRPLHSWIAVAEKQWLRP